MRIQPLLVSAALLMTACPPTADTNTDTDIDTDTDTDTDVSRPSCPPDSFGDISSQELAEEVDADAVFSATVEVGVSDFFSVLLPPGGLVSVAVETTDPDAVAVHVFNEAMMEVGSGTSLLLENSSLSDATFWIEVANNSLECVIYGATFDATDMVCADGFEPNDDTFDATELGSSIVSAGLEGLDVDVFTLDVETNSRFSLSLVTMLPGASLDYQIESAMGDVVAMGTANGETRATGRYDGPPGPLYLILDEPSVGPTCLAYDVQMTTNSCLAADEHGMNHSVSDAVEVLFDIRGTVSDRQPDFFALGNVLDLATVSLRSEADVTLTLLDDAGTELATASGVD